jgi:hypothetical protein
VTANYIFGNGAGLTGVSAESSNYSSLAGTASSAAYATLAGSATTAATANYATLSGQATNAATADYATLAGTASSAATVADASITAAKFVTGAVTSGAIANNTITASKMGTGSVTSDAILDGTITGADLNTAINISTTGIITADSFKGGNVYVPSGKNAYLSNDTTSGSSAITVPMIAAGSISAGDVVIIDSTASNQVKRTTNPADQGVAGFATNNVTVGQTVYVAVAGKVTNAKTENIGNIVRGDYLETTGVNGAVRRVDKKLTVGATVGIALTDESGSQVSVLIQIF